MGRPKRSTIASSLKSTKNTAKSTKAAKNAVNSGISFKTAKITRWSEKEDKKAEGVLKVEVKETIVEDVKVVEKSEQTLLANTPKRLGRKRSHVDLEEPEDTNRVKVSKVSKVTKSSKTTVAVVPSDPATTSSIPSDISTAVTELDDDDDDDKDLPAAKTLPKSITRLVTIYKSIISILMLHYATNSSSQPAILSEILTNISREANTNVSLIDLQRITTLSRNSLRLVNVDGVGNAIELVGGVSAKVSNLGVEFKVFIEKWYKEKAVAGDAENDILEGVELAPVVPYGSAAKSAKTTQPATPSKGQRRLMELKSFALTKQTAQAAQAKKENVPTDSKGTLASRNSSLMERIKAKALAAKASAAAPVPPEEIQRRIALQSLESVIPILLHLTTPPTTFGSKQAKIVVTSTTSYPLHTIITNIKTSLQKPMSNQEIERCLRLLADEVASDFVKIVEWKGDSTGKGLVGVVLDRRGREKIEKWRYEEATS